MVDIIRELQEYGIEVLVSDPVAEKEDVLREYGIRLSEYDDINNVDAIILAVSHKEYRDIPLDKLQGKFSEGRKVFMDVKGIHSPYKARESGYLYWSL